MGAEGAWSQLGQVAARPSRPNYLPTLNPYSPTGMPWRRKDGQSKGRSQGGKRKPTNQEFRTVASLEELEQLQNEFESFLGVVNQDIEVKTEYWSALKKGEVVGWESSREVLGKKLETYASIQSFMLHRYSKRIAKFRRASLESQRRICEVSSLSECERESWAEVLIERHMHILVKMKRRLKHMMDVSDKYFLTDLLDTLHLLGQATSELAPPMEGEGYNMDSLSSSSSFDNLSTSTSYLSLSSPTISSISYTSSSSSSSSTAPSRHLKLRPFRSLLDQLVVLGKTYTERGD